MNSAKLQIRLKPLGDRDASSAQIAARLGAAAADSARTRVLLRPVQDLTLDDQISNTDYRLGLQSADPELLRQWATQVMATLKADPVFADVGSASAEQGAEIYLDFDRAAQARLGITQQQVDDTLYDAFGQRQISTIFHAGQSVPRGDGCRRHARIARRAAAQRLRDRRRAPGRARSPNWRARRCGRLPLTVQRKDQFRYADVSFNLAPRQSLDVALTHVGRAIRQLNIPAGVSVAFEGATKIFVASLANEAFLVLAAVFVVYITLGVLYESLVHPLTILSTLPSAALGALLTLWATRLGFDVMGLIGIVLLIGIVMKNAIMMIDFALELERQQGMNAVEAVTRAAALRFRADSDDHHGVSFRRHTACVRQRHGIRIAAPARGGHHRRTAA